jgi:hypothetical protein
VENKPRAGGREFVGGERGTLELVDAEQPAHECG